MSYYTIEIDDKVINEQIQGILNECLNNELHLRYSGAGYEISTAVKELIYSRKDEIVEMVVDRAAKELVKKGLPKLIEKFGGNGQ